MPDMDWAGFAALVMVVPGDEGEVRTVPAAVVQMDAGPELNVRLIAHVKENIPHWLPVGSPVTEHLPSEAVKASLYVRMGSPCGVSVASWRDEEVVFDSATQEIDVPGWRELAQATGRVLVLWGMWSRGSKLNDVAALEDCARHGHLMGAWADLIQ